VIKSRGSARRGRRLAVVVALAATCGAVFLGSAGTANAGNLITCGGKIVPSNPKKVGTDVHYSLSCSEDIRGYSVISTKTFDFFGTETDVTPTVSQSATLQCEGTVPGNGFGCGVVDQYAASNCGSSPKPNCQTVPPCGTTKTTIPCNSKVSAGNFISGDVSFSKSPCLGLPKVWVTATSDPLVTSFAPSGDTSTVGEYGSQPFRLKVKGFTKGKCAKVVKQNDKAEAKAKK
jgi:hypothetical protein